MIVLVTMYVDESGSESYKDSTKYFVLSGIIVSDDKIKKIQRSSFEYKLKYFIDKYIDSEIHTHDIYQSKNDFSSLNLIKKQEILNALYKMINTLNITIISIVINKELLKSQYPSWKVIDTAWIYLIERFDKFLECNDEINGSIKIDKSTHRSQRCIFDVIDDVRKNGTDFQRRACIDNIQFVDSSGVEGIQIADAVAYCSLMHAKNNNAFEDYWNLIKSKIRQSSDGHTKSYGWKEFPGFLKNKSMQQGTPHSTHSLVMRPASLDINTAAYY